MAAADLFLYNADDRRAGSKRSATAPGGFTYASGQWDPGWAVRMTDFNNDGLGDLLLSNADGTWIQATNTGIGTFGYAAGNWGTGWTVYTNK